MASAARRRLLRERNKSSPFTFTRVYLSLLIFSSSCHLAPWGLWFEAHQALKVTTKSMPRRSCGGAPAPPALFTTERPVTVYDERGRKRRNSVIAPPAQSEVPVKRERILNRFEALKTELRPTLRLAGPLVLAELGWMSMAVVDTVMVGRVSPEAIAGVSLGGLVFYTAATFGSGLLLGLDTLVSQAFGAGKLTDCHRSLVSSLYLCLCLAPALMGGIWLVAPCLRSFGIHPSVLHETMPNLRALMWSTLPLLLYFAFRRYLQGMGLVRPVTFALVTANLVNALGNWVLIYGHLGAPPLGAEGSGWSTCCSRIYMAAVLVGYTLYDNRGRRAGTSKTQNAVWPNRPDLARIGQLLRLGFPAALQLSLEVGVWATAAALASRLGPVSAAGYQIAMITVSLTYMVPLGISAAAAVRVGHALGRDDPEGAARSGWAAILLGAAFMSCAALALLLVPRYIAGAFTLDPAVIKMGALLLSVAALFQLCDGLQTVATGALRGAGDTRTPMICHLLAYWLVGLPLGYFLCFSRGWGAAGLWAGLSLAVILIGVVLSLAWRRRVVALLGAPAPAR